MPHIKYVHDKVTWTSHAMQWERIKDTCWLKHMNTMWQTKIHENSNPDKLRNYIPQHNHHIDN